eukprot:767491-Hanusia_phi.AAC.7
MLRGCWQLERQKNTKDDSEEWKIRAERASRINQLLLPKLASLLSGEPAILPQPCFPLTGTHSENAGIKETASEDGSAFDLALDLQG